MVQLNRLTKTQKKTPGRNRSAFRHPFGKTPDRRGQPITAGHRLLNQMKFHTFSLTQPEFYPI